MNFASDNWAGAAPQIAEALAFQTGAAPAYGGDDLTAEVTAQFSQLFDRDVAVFFVASGTAANALALTALAKPAGLVFCHADAHANTDEGGAAEFLAGVKLIGLDGAGGKVATQTLSAAIDRFPPNATRYGQVVALSLSQLTEFGTAYSPAEVGALSAIAKEAGLAVQMDGARFGNAVAGLGATPAELTWRAGVDVLCFGGTKGGCWQAESVIFFEPERAAEFAYVRKRAGHLISKSRFIAAQFNAFFKDNLWLDLAAQANRMAAHLADGVTSAGGRIAWPTQGNEVFAILPRGRLSALREAGAVFYEWPADGLSPDQRPGRDEAVVRLVTSFATTGAEIERFVSA